MSVVLLGSTSGSVTLQEPAVAGSTVIDLPATSGTMAVLPTATSVLPQASGGTGTTTGYYGFKNRIINGAMVIDQRNAGAAVNNGYPVDRFQAFYTGISTLVTTGQQVSDAPAGFNYSLKYTVTTAAGTFNSGARAGVLQRIEGYNLADLGWGTASAATVTLSFWVKASIAGAYSGALYNSASDRSYPFSFNINSTNTWEQKSITIAGDTSGTWLKDNGRGVTVEWCLGAESAKLGTANTWASAWYTGVTGTTALVNTLNATFYITGVQLEKGSTATSFDYRPYGTELQLCQRYAVVYNTRDSNTANRMGFGIGTTTTTAGLMIKHPVTMRAKASLSTAFTTALSDTVNAFATTALATQSITSDENQTIVLATVSSGLTAFRPYFFEFSGSGTLTLSSEL